MQKYVWSGTIIYNQVLFLLQKGHLAQKTWHLNTFYNKLLGEGKW